MPGPAHDPLTERAEEVVPPTLPAPDDHRAGGEAHDQVRHAGGAGGDGVVPDGRRPRLAGGRGGLDFACPEGPETRCISEAGDTAARAQLLERAGCSRAPGVPIDDGVPDLGQGTGAAQHPTRVDDPGPDARRDGEVGDRPARRAGAERRLARRRPGRRRWRWRWACPGAPSASPRTAVGAIPRGGGAPRGAARPRSRRRREGRRQRARPPPGRAPRPPRPRGRSARRARRPRQGWGRSGAGGSRRAGPPGRRASASRRRPPPGRVAASPLCRDLSGAVPRLAEQLAKVGQLLGIDVFALGIEGLARAPRW